MVSRPTFIGANWKMNPPPKGALVDGSPYHSDGNPEIVVFPTFIDLHHCIRNNLAVGAQCGRADADGAFTGDISMTMLRDFGCSHVLCGHSERRTHHHETDAMVAGQVHSALQHDLIPVLCIGETSEERAAGRTNEVVQVQLSAILGTAKTALTEKNIIIAYEPVWAIGTGKTPTPEEANVTHAFIRSLLPSPDIRIIYGGSMNGTNAAGFLAQPDIDGGLPGGASLKPDDFAKIVAAARA